jgi:hypothetical protein
MFIKNSIIVLKVVFKYIDDFLRYQLDHATKMVNLFSNSEEQKLKTVEMKRQQEKKFQNYFPGQFRIAK